MNWPHVYWRIIPKNSIPKILLEEIKLNYKTIPATGMDNDSKAKLKEKDSVIPVQDVTPGLEIETKILDQVSELLMESPSLLRPRFASSEAWI